MSEGREREMRGADERRRVEEEGKGKGMRKREMKEWLGGGIAVTRSVCVTRWCVRHVNECRDSRHQK